MSESMTMMNAAEQKMSTAAENFNTGASMNASIVDATNQTRHRQEHVKAIQEMVDTARRTSSPVDLDALSETLGDLNDRCPSMNACEQWGQEARERFRTGFEDLNEAREIMAKVRDIESTRITHGG